jgi:hypothetical protein
MSALAGQCVHAYSSFQGVLLRDGTALCDRSSVMRCCHKVGRVVWRSSKR